MITRDGKAANEILRILGEAGRMFTTLDTVWKHTGIITKRKVHLYYSCIPSKLRHSLNSLWLLQADRRRLDAFHCKCLRRVLRIPHSYVSHVTNRYVLNKAASSLLSEDLIRRQQRLYTKIAQQPPESLIRQLLCDGNGLPKSWTNRRRRGRPRQQWASSVHASILARGFI